MNSYSVAQFYLTINILIFIAWLGTLVFSKLSKRIKYGSLLKVNYFTVAIIIIVIGLYPVLPRTHVLTPVTKIWSTQLNDISAQDNAPLQSNDYLYLSERSSEEPPALGAISNIFRFIFLAFLLLGLKQIIREIQFIRKLSRKAILIRKLYSVSIYSSDTLKTPLSFWIPFQKIVILPSNLLTHPLNFRIALSHELQHHRQNDTLWIYALWMLKLLCPLNPAIYFWSCRVCELQEFACDENLLGQGKIDSQAYACCLYQVAESALEQNRIPVCATGLTSLLGRNLLKRRIETMLNPSPKFHGRTKATIFCAALMTVMIATAYASKTVVQDRRITMEQAEEMAKAHSTTGSFPIEVNDLVVSQLNRYIGTPGGRETMRAALKRLEDHRGIVEAKLSQYNIPQEFIAVPIIESGYQNLSESNTKGWGAGLWMFIKPTARSYGLKVDSKTDERLDVKLLTDAAMRYFKTSYLRFKDWQLSALAYNIGEQRVQQGIDKTGSRDAWKLVRSGYENDKNYLAKLVAAILIMKNPKFLD